VFRRRRGEHANRQHFTGYSCYADIHRSPWRQPGGRHNKRSANRDEDAADEHAYAGGHISGSGPVRARTDDTCGTDSRDIRSARWLPPAY
jgi:hypothetical protein